MIQDSAPPIPPVIETAIGGEDELICVIRWIGDKLWCSVVVQGKQIDTQLYPKGQTSRLEIRGVASKVSGWQ